MLFKLKVPILKAAALKLILLFLLPCAFIWGEISFSGLDISADNNLLFSANFPGLYSHDVLFSSRIADRSIRALTVFPERMELLDDGRTLQVRNSSGSFRIPVSGGLPTTSYPTGSSFPSSTNMGRTEEISVSPNGRWILSMAAETHAYGSLVLRDVLTGTSITIASGLERPEKIFPASWSSDSRFFIYSRLGKLYYATVNQTAPLVDERFRYIGEGAINSIYWRQNGEFFYIKGSTIYRVRGSELFTRALYADVLDIGDIVGNIPFEFDPHFDLFWMAPDSASLLLSKGGRNIFYYPLGNEDYLNASVGLTYLVLPRASFNTQVFWPASGGITIIASVQQGRETQVLAWRMDPGANNKVFNPIAAPPESQARLSPDGRFVLFWGERGVSLYDYANWRLLSTINSRRTYFCLWSGNEEIITGDEARIERVHLSTSGARVLGRDLICLSGATRFGFENTSRNGSYRILAQNNGTWYATDGREGPWVEITNPQIRVASQVSTQYRVYLEQQNSGPYENLPMVRNLTSVGTFSLIPIIPFISANTISAAASELALCFDLYDDAEGLSEILEALDRFNIKATFFLGGEFLRRYPAAAADIAAAGHEAASLFFANIDLSDSRYQIDSSFITRGLARNEDEYFNATGRELSLYWHPPWYSASSDAISAAALAGYVTISRDIDPYDWVSREDEKQFGLPQYSAADLIDNLMARIIAQAKPGCIIPIRLGLLPGSRSDYLFQRINVLLDALAEQGYTVVPVSKLR